MTAIVGPYTRYCFGGAWRLPALGAVLLYLLVSAGCATTTAAPGQARWKCDAAADAAVDRNDLKTALEMHQQVVRLAPDNCLAIYHLGYIWGRLGDRSEEVARYERALECGYDQDDRFLYNLGMAYGDLGRNREALEAFTAAVRLNESRADNHFGLGLMYQSSGQYEKAEAAFSRTLARDADYHEARVALVRILLDQGRLEPARSNLEMLAQAAPDNEEVQALWRLLRQRSSMLYER